MTQRLPDSRYACTRLLIALALMTVGSSAMYVVAVVLPAVQAEFGSARAEASLPYTLMMVGFGLGGIAMGRLADRRGVMWVVLLGSMGLSSRNAPSLQRCSRFWCVAAITRTLAFSGWWPPTR